MPRKEEGVVLIILLIELIDRRCAEYMYRIFLDVELAEGATPLGATPSARNDGVLSTRVCPHDSGVATSINSFHSFNRF